MQPHMININIHQSGQGILLEVFGQLLLSVYKYDKYNVQFQKKKFCQKKIFKSNSYIRRTPQFRPVFA